MTKIQKYMNIKSAKVLRFSIGGMESPKHQVNLKYRTRLSGSWIGIHNSGGSRLGRFLYRPPNVAGRMTSMWKKKMTFSQLNVASLIPIANLLEMP